MTEVVRTAALTKRFGALVAVDGLDLDVAAGEVFGFLGPNGAGKTTTIRLLLGLLRPSAGGGDVLGRPLGDVDARDRIGYLPADLALDPRWTGADALAFFAALHDRPAEPMPLCERFDLDPTRRIGELSTGNRRKVGIVVAFQHRPDLLILDEPTSGLDPLLQREFHMLVRERVGAGATVFLSSHVIPEVEALAGRVGIIRGGRLVRDAPLEDLRLPARQHLELHVDGPVDLEAFRRAPGVVSAEVTGSVVRVSVDGDADGVVKAAARHHVRRIESGPGELDETFRELYADGTP